LLRASHAEVVTMASSSCSAGIHELHGAPVIHNAGRSWRPMASALSERSRRQAGRKPELGAGRDGEAHGRMPWSTRSPSDEGGDTGRAMTGTSGTRYASHQALRNVDRAATKVKNNPEPASSRKVHTFFVTCHPGLEEVRKAPGWLCNACLLRRWYYPTSLVGYGVSNGTCIYAEKWVYYHYEQLAPHMEQGTTYCGRPASPMPEH
jgi:hypothetical protein